MVDAHFVKETLGDLVPPDSKPKNDRQRWEVAMSTGLGLVSVIGGAHILQACGFLGWLGLSGFAMADQVQAQQTTLVSIQIGQINRDMRDAKRQICVAQVQKNQAALNSWSNELQAARVTYFSITKQWPEVQSCEELLVTTGKPD